MGKDFEPILFRACLSKWTAATTARRELEAHLGHSGVGESIANPAPLPPEVASRPAAQRCQWALNRLAEERKTLAHLRLREQQGAQLRARLERLRDEKQAAETAAARQRVIRWATVAVVAAAILAIPAYIHWQRRPPALPRSALENALAPALAQRGLALKSLSFRAGPQYRGVAGISATFTATLIQPLYAPLPAARYLEEEMKMDLGANRQITELLSAKEGPRLLQIAGFSVRPPDLTRIALVKLATPPGKAFDGSAGLRAVRRGGSWQVSLDNLSIGAFPQDQRPRGQLEGEAFDVGRPEDLARLRALAGEQTGTLAKLQEARQKLLAEAMAGHRSEEQALTGFFRPGAIFTSTVAVRKESRPVYLEIIESSANSDIHTLKAMFHNDGGWGDGRLFEGEWKYDSATEGFQVALTSLSDQVIRSGGPVLDNPQMIHLLLAVKGERLIGSLAGTASEWSRVPDEETEHVKRAASPDYFAMLDALQPAAIYSGVVKTSATGSEQILLRFGGVPDAGSPVQAVLEDPSHPAWQFQLAGPLIGNRYREAHWPLRLTQIRDSVPPGIPPKAFLPRLSSLALHMENDTLMGDYRGQTFRFEPLSLEETTRRRQMGAMRQQVLQSLLRAGVVASGDAVDAARSQRSQLRLLLLKVESGANTLEARLESAAAPTLYRQLAGKIYPEAGVISLVFDIRPNTYGVARTAIEPWFKGGRDTLTLAVDGSSLAGQDSHGWTFAFRSP